jgi:hypothetical protein
MGLRVIARVGGLGEFYEIVDYFVMYAPSHAVIVGTRGLVVLFLLHELGPIKNKHRSTDDLQDVFFLDRLFGGVLTT